ncbi:MAG: hypothetical protein IJR85_01495 [Synergistaceae bacterium]|nr:hypothetical protein [Synergistaceae bacterium]
MRFAAIIFAVLAVFAVPAFAAENIPGEVLAVFQNPGVNDVTAESIAEGGEHAQWVNETAESLDAEVVRIYESVSVAGNEIMVLLRAKSGNAEALLEELGERSDVKAASLNYIRQRVRHKKTHKGGK